MLINIGMMVYDNQTVLQEFQKFLQERKLVPENQVPFHAHWAGFSVSPEDLTSPSSSTMRGQ
jgi:hypothetical protein